MIDFQEQCRKSELTMVRFEMVKSLLDVLHAAMQADCPPGKKAVEDTVWAARELLTIE